MSKNGTARVRAAGPIILSALGLVLGISVIGVGLSRAAGTADIEVTATGPAALGLGAQGSFIVKVVNKGPNDAGTVWLVPAGSANFTGYETVLAGQGTCKADGSCDLGTIASGDTVFVGYCLTAADEGQGSQTFIGSNPAGDFDPNPPEQPDPNDVRGNNDAVVTVNITPGGPAPGCSGSLPKPPPDPGQASCNGKTPTIVATEEKTQGTDGDDVIAGRSKKANRIQGGAGKDIICGGKKFDGINGGKGNDKIFGKAKDDALDGKAGNDLVDGGSGRDTLRGGTGDDICIGDVQIDYVIKGQCEKLKND